jgi:DNA (cytosine-5)-methyltransferase 1
VADGGDHRRPTVALLPSPNAGLGEHGRDSGQDPEKRRAQGRQVSLADVACYLPGQQAPLLPTPAAADGQRGQDFARAGRDGSGGDDLVTLVVKATKGGLLLPTPAAQDGNGGGRYSSDGHQTTLPGEARLLCTPSASDGAGGKTSRSGSRIDEPLLGGQAREMATAWGKYEPAIRRWEHLTGPAPAPTEPNKNGNPRLSAAFSQWLMGWPDGWVTDPAIGLSRNDQLRIVGNGVCPQQAAAALRYLLTIAEVAA